jgi:hypothetical protein
MENPMFTFLLAQGPAETTKYMIAGYAVIFGAMFIYLVSLFARYRSYRREMTMLKELASTRSFRQP